MQPIRSCAGCRERREQAALTRFTYGPNGWVPDRGTRRDGRGVYLCSAKCVERVAKNKRFPGLAADAREAFSAEYVSH